MSAMNPTDKQATDQLLRQAMASSKLAAKGDGQLEIPEQAFADHEDFVKTLEDILRSDKTTSMDPNGDLVD